MQGDKENFFFDKVKKHKNTCPKADKLELNWALKFEGWDKFYPKNEFSVYTNIHSKCIKQV